MLEDRGTSPEGTGELSCQLLSEARRAMAPLRDFVHSALSAEVLSLCARSANDLEPPYIGETMKVPRVIVLSMLVTMQLMGCGGPPSVTERDSLVPSTAASTEAPLPTEEPDSATSKMGAVEIHILRSQDASRSCRRCVICEQGGKHCGKPVCCDVVE